MDLSSPNQPTTTYNSYPLFPHFSLHLIIFLQSRCFCLENILKKLSLCKLVQQYLTLIRSFVDSITDCTLFQAREEMSRERLRYLEAMVMSSCISFFFFYPFACVRYMIFASAKLGLGFECYLALAIN